MRMILYTCRIDSLRMAINNGQSLYHGHILLQTLSKNVNKRPLGIALEQPCPESQNGHPKSCWFEIKRCLRIFLQVYARVGFFDDAPGPTENAAFIF